jgi:hypothetical protein
MRASPSEADACEQKEPSPGHRCDTTALARGASATTLAAINASWTTRGSARAPGRRTTSAHAGPRRRGHRRRRPVLLYRRQHGSGRGAAALDICQAEAEARSPASRGSTRLVVRESGRAHAAPERRVRGRCYLGGVPGGPDRVISRTTTSGDGFIADGASSNGWLFAVGHGHAQRAQREQFLERIGVLVEGSITYGWVLAEANLLAEPDKWRDFYWGSSEVRVHQPRASSATWTRRALYRRSGPRGIADHPRGGGRRRHLARWRRRSRRTVLRCRCLRSVDVSIAPVTTRWNGPRIAQFVR